MTVAERRQRRGKSGVSAVSKEAVEERDQKSAGRVEGVARDGEAVGEGVGPAEEEVGDDCGGRVGVGPGPGEDFGGEEGEGVDERGDGGGGRELAHVLGVRREGGVGGEREDEGLD